MLGTDGRDYAGTYPSYTDTSYYRGNMNTSTIAAYMWNYDTSISVEGSNNWTTSEFNKINLNTNYINYLNNIDSKWADMIATTTWHLGGLYNTTGKRSKEFYEGERNNAGYESNPTTYRDEIGLMYPSDYGYATSPENWNTLLGYYEQCTDVNWMYMGLNEWTITPDSSDSANVFYVHYSGGLGYFSGYSYSARPVFYLNSNVYVIEGNGSKSDPYIIGM